MVIFPIAKGGLQLLTGASSQGPTVDPGTSGLVSPIVAKVILENRPLLASDFTQPVPGIVLCADLSGFSMAGAALTRSEARGAEQLQGIVNAVFTRVTEAIQTGGGTILQFSGDAMTAVWPANGPSPHQALRAIAAGLALQSACRNLSVAEMTGLRMRAALSQGQAWIAHLTEGAESPETVICGDVFDAFRDAGGFRDGVVGRKPVASCVVSDRPPRNGGAGWRWRQGGEADIRRANGGPCA